eukprot:5540550-Heterocapsa_arctica.AAC.1
MLKTESNWADLGVEQRIGKIDRTPHEQSRATRPPWPQLRRDSCTAVTPRAGTPSYVPSGRVIPSSPTPFARSDLGGGVRSVAVVQGPPARLGLA